MGTILCEGKGARWAALPEMLQQHKRVVAFSVKFPLLLFFNSDLHSVRLAITQTL